MIKRFVYFFTIIFLSFFIYTFPVLAGAPSISKCDSLGGQTDICGPSSADKNNDGYLECPSEVPCPNGGVGWRIGNQGLCGPAKGGCTPCSTDKEGGRVACSSSPIATPYAPGSCILWNDNPSCTCLGCTTAFGGKGDCGNYWNICCYNVVGGVCVSPGGDKCKSPDQCPACKEGCSKKCTNGACSCDCSEPPKPPKPPIPTCTDPVWPQPDANACMSSHSGGSTTFQCYKEVTYQETITYDVCSSCSTEGECTGYGCSLGYCCASTTTQSCSGCNGVCGAVCTRCEPSYMKTVTLPDPACSVSQTSHSIYKGQGVNTSPCSPNGGGYITGVSCGNTAACSKRFLSPVGCSVAKTESCADGRCSNSGTTTGSCGGNFYPLNHMPQVNSINIEGTSGNQITKGNTYTIKANFSDADTTCDTSLDYLWENLSCKGEFEGDLRGTTCNPGTASIKFKFFPNQCVSCQIKLTITDPDNDIGSGTLTVGIKNYAPIVPSSGAIINEDPDATIKACYYKERYILKATDPDNDSIFIKTGSIQQRCNSNNPSLRSGTLSPSSGEFQQICCDSGSPGCCPAMCTPPGNTSCSNYKTFGLEFQPPVGFPEAYTDNDWTCKVGGFTVTDYCGATATSNETKDLTVLPIFNLKTEVKKSSLAYHECKPLDHTPPPPPGFSGAWTSINQVDVTLKATNSRFPGGYAASYPSGQTCVTNSSCTISGQAAPSETGAGLISYQEVPVPDSPSSKVSLVSGSNYTTQATSGDPCDTYSFSCAYVTDNQRTAGPAPTANKITCPVTNPPSSTSNSGCSTIDPSVWDKAMIDGAPYVNAALPDVKTCGTTKVELGYAEVYKKSWSISVDGDVSANSVTNTLSCRAAGSVQSPISCRPGTFPQNLCARGDFKYISFNATDPYNRTGFFKLISDMSSSNVDSLVYAPDNRGGVIRNLGSNPAHNSKWLDVFTYKVPSIIGSVAVSAVPAVIDSNNLNDGVYKTTSNTLIFNTDSTINVGGLGGVAIIYVEPANGDAVRIQSHRSTDETYVGKLSIATDDTVIIISKNSVIIDRNIGFPYNLDNGFGDDIISGYTLDGTPSMGLNIVSGGTVTVEKRDYETDYRCPSGTCEKSVATFFGIDVPIMIKGPIIANGSVQFGRSIGTGKRTYNDSYPSEAVQYDRNLLYNVTSFERDNLPDGLDTTGVTIYDVQWIYE